MRYNGVDSQRSAETLANDRNPERRPDPDALLALTEKGKRGKLLVFLGAAPGVGKTYAMLQRARLLREEGVDIVVGLVETHSRAETEALTQGLEILPRKKVRWQGREIEEFDLDGALAPPAQADHRRRTRPHQRAGEPPPQALAGRRGAARRAHRRLDRAQHPAPREPRRRRLAHRRRQRARDRSRHRAARRRRHRAGRHHVGRPDPAPERRQGLSAGDGAAGAAEILHPAQPDRAARDRAAPDGGAGRRPDGRAVAPGRDRRPVGDQRAPAGLRRPRRAVDGRGAGGEPARHRPQRELGGGDGRPAGRRRRRRRRDRRGAAAGAEPGGGNDPAGRPRHAGRDPRLRRAREHHPGRRRPLEGGLPRPPRRPLALRRAGAPRQPGRRACRHRRQAARSAARAQPRRRVRPRPADRRARCGRLGRRRRRRRRGARPLAAPAQPVDDLPHRGAAVGGAFRRARGDRGGGAVVSRLRLLLRPALLPVHHRRAGGILRPRHLPRRGEPGRLARRPGARPGAAGARQRPGDKLAVRVLAQAFRRGDARRHPRHDDRLRPQDADERAASSCCCPRTASCR